jgi:hypothetical protein
VAFRLVNLISVQVISDAEKRRRPAMTIEMLLSALAMGKQGASKSHQCTFPFQDFVSRREIV